MTQYGLQRLSSLRTFRAQGWVTFNSQDKTVTGTLMTTGIFLIYFKNEQTSKSAKIVYRVVSRKNYSAAIEIKRL